MMTRKLKKWSALRSQMNSSLALTVAVAPTQTKLARIRMRLQMFHYRLLPTPKFRKLNPLLLYPSQRSASRILLRRVQTRKKRKKRNLERKLKRIGARVPSWE
jgi:hypothetical protein